MYSYNCFLEEYDQFKMMNLYIGLILDNYNEVMSLSIIKMSTNSQNNDDYDEEYYVDDNEEYYYEDR